MECLCSFSSFSKSEKEEPSATEPLRVTVLVAKSMASASVVLPLPPWPVSRTLRMSAVAWEGIDVAPAFTFSQKRPAQPDLRYDAREVHKYGEGRGRGQEICRCRLTNRNPTRWGGGD